MCKGRGHNASKRPSPAPSPQPLAPGILSNFLGLLPLLLAEEFFSKLRPRLASPRRQQAPLKGKAASRSPESHRPARPTEFRSLSSLSGRLRGVRSSGQRPFWPAGAAHALRLCGVPLRSLLALPGEPSPHPHPCLARPWFHSHRPLPCVRVWTAGGWGCRLDPGIQPQAVPRLLTTPWRGPGQRVQPATPPPPRPAPDRGVVSEIGGLF